MLKPENKKLIDKAESLHSLNGKSQSRNSENDTAVPIRRREYKETALLFIKMLIALFLCETAVIVLLNIIPLKRDLEIIIDPLLLTALGTLILYWLFVRPYRLSLLQRNRAMDALQISEKKLAESQKIANLGSWEMNLLTNEESWSDQTYLLLGLEPGEVSPCYKTFLSIVHPEDREAITTAIQKAVSQNKPYEAEFRVIRKDGAERIMYSRGEINFDESGKPERLVGMDQDITERKKMEDRLRFLSHITEQVDDSVITTDLNFKITWVNKAFQKLYGYHPEEVLGRTPDFPNVEPNSEEIQNNIYETVSSGKVFRGEVLNQKKDGSVFPCELMIFPLLDEQGNIFAYAGHQRDITERKKAKEAMEKSELMYRTLVEANPYGIQEIDTSGIITYTNPAYQKMLGYNEQELLGKSILDLLEPQSRRDELRDYLSMILKEQPQPITYYQKNRTKDNSVIDMAVDWNYNRDNEGRVVGFTSVITDITEYKKAEKIIQQESLMRKTLLDHIPCIALILKKETREIIACNETARKMGAVVGKTCYESCAKRDKPCPFCRAPQVWKTNKPNRIEAEFDDTYYDGIWVPLTEDSYIHYIFNISERKLAEQKVLDDQAQLKSLASQLSLTEERERHRLATELHDQIGQSLVFSKIKLDQIRQSASSEKLTKALDEVSNNLRQVIGDTRTLTFDLSSPILYELGFEAAVAEWLNHQIQEKHGIKTEFNDDKQQKPMDDDIRAILFRNVRELLINVIKHAQANKVKISISRLNEHINIEIEDDGVGFDLVKAASTAAEETKFGLFSIRQRLEQLGGQFEIDTKPGSGTRVTMTAPLKLT